MTLVHVSEEALEGFESPYGKRNKSGYIYVYVPDVGWVREHRRVMERVLGRKLLPSEVVHHIDLNRGNNEPYNLAVMSLSEHTHLHQDQWMSAADKAIVIGYLVP